MQTEALLNPASKISEAEATQIVSRFGYQARKVRPGFFIAPVTVNRYGHRRIGDDAMYIDSHGKITLYNDDAQAFFAAKALSAAIRKA